MFFRRGLVPFLHDAGERATHKAYNTWLSRVLARCLTNSTVSQSPIHANALCIDINYMLGLWCLCVLSDTPTDAYICNMCVFVMHWWCSSPYTTYTCTSAHSHNGQHCVADGLRCELRPTYPGSRRCATTATHTHTVIQQRRQAWAWEGSTRCRIVRGHISWWGWWFGAGLRSRTSAI